MAARTEVDRPVRVTGLVPDPRRPGCVRVQIEYPAVGEAGEATAVGSLPRGDVGRAGRVLLTVPAEVAQGLGLQVDGPLSAPAEETLARAADAEAAFRTALGCLERRPYARRDLERRLVLRGHPPEAAIAAVGKAGELGLLDDEKFARHYIETRFARGRGPGRLRHELTALGVAPGLVDRLLAEVVPTDLARQRMLALARKRADQLHHLESPDRLRRVLAYLARRGYRGAEVRGVVRELIR
jgi:regulatory protein